MSEDQATPSRQRVPLPVGYRQGIITAVTVLLGFSLLFFRYWDFELPGEWTVSAIVAAVLMGVSILLQFVSLWRSLQLKDDDEIEYGRTLRWFLASVLTLLVSLAIAGLTISHLIKF
ncbi:MAG TPA: hypothetical protein VE178_13015 [Silvibacterium sp.]|nr:hypothetical protein [Silvibacterium sp.]